MDAESQELRPRVWMLLKNWSSSLEDQNIVYMVDINMQLISKSIPFFYLKLS